MSFIVRWKSPPTLKHVSFPRMPPSSMSDSESVSLKKNDFVEHRARRIHVQACESFACNVKTCGQFRTYEIPTVRYCCSHWRQSGISDQVSKVSQKNSLQRSKVRSGPKGAPAGSREIQVCSSRCHCRVGKGGQRRQRCRNVISQMRLRDKSGGIPVTA